MNIEIPLCLLDDGSTVCNYDFESHDNQEMRKVSLQLYIETNVPGEQLPRRKF